MIQNLGFFFYLSSITCHPGIPGPCPSAVSGPQWWGHTCAPGWGACRGRASEWDCGTPRKTPAVPSHSLVWRNAWPPYNNNNNKQNNCYLPLGIFHFQDKIYDCRFLIWLEELINIHVKSWNIKFCYDFSGNLQESTMYSSFLYHHLKSLGTMVSAGN